MPAIRESSIVHKLGLEGYVKIISGMLDKLKLKHYLYLSDVIVFPFKLLFSQPPSSLLEAMRLRKVIVTTDLGTL
jgi:glycosyltransferase involved in cell wall biosynthesis